MAVGVIACLVFYFSRESLNSLTSQRSRRPPKFQPIFVCDCDTDWLDWRGVFIYRRLSVDEVCSQSSVCEDGGRSIHLGQRHRRCAQWHTQNRTYALSI